MYKGKTPQRLIIPPHNIDSQAPTSTITAKKRKTVFLTQNKKLTGEQLVLEQHNELINYIDTLQNQVQKIIESHDSQFLIAYKNHLSRVRQEMQELKNKNSKQANSSSGQTERIETLQKELIIFREESLKLFDRMTEKQKQIDLLNMRVYELQTQQKFSKRTVADLMRRNKQLEALVKDFDLNKTQFKQKIEIQQSTEKKKSISFLEVNSLKKYSSQQRRTSKHVGKTDYSFFYKNNQIFNSQQGKQSRPTTTALGSKRNSLSMHNHNTIKSVNDYFAKNFAPNFRNP